jgi:hypothetical protein
MEVGLWQAWVPKTCGQIKQHWHLPLQFLAREHSRHNQGSAIFRHLIAMLAGDPWHKGWQGYHHLTLEPLRLGRIADALPRCQPYSTKQNI